MEKSDKPALEPRTFDPGGQNKTGIKGKSVCKICGYPFGMGELKKGEDRKQHECRLVHTKRGTLARQELAAIINQ